MARNGNDRRQSPPPRPAVKSPQAATPDPYRAPLEAALEHKRRGRLAKAEAIYGQVLTDRPDHPQANFEYAQLLLRIHRHEEATQYWEQALAGLPDNLAARFNYAYCLHKANRAEEALEQYKRAFRIMRSQGQRVPPEVLHGVYFGLARTLEGLIEDEDVDDALGGMILSNPQAEIAHAALAGRYARRGKTEEAMASIRKAISISPDLAIAHRDLAFLKKHTELDDEVRQMQSLYESGSGTPEDQYHLAFALGKAYEDVGKYQQAFAYWRRGNAIHLRLYPYDVSADIATHSALAKGFTCEYMQKEASQSETEVTPVFIVGMPRTGSSLAEQILASHSMVYGAGEIATLWQACRDAVPRYPRDLGHLARQDWARLATAYTAKAGTAMGGTERYLTDKLLGNYSLIGAIRMMFPNARVINCAREPMDSAISCFKNHFGPGAAKFSYRLEDLGEMYRQYEELMIYWHKTLPGFIYDLHYEKLVADPEGEIRRLLRFVGLPFEEACLTSHTSKRVTATASGAQVRAPIHNRSVEKWRHLEAELRPFEAARKKNTFAS